ncbi:MAG: S8 family serine peptidase, partial [Tissierellales bacterium]
PDVVAPGVNINSLSNTELDGYKKMSGTSMATPLISGSIALLLDKYGNLSPDEVKKMLLNSCIDLKDTPENQGSGLVNLQKLFNDNKNEKNTNKYRKAVSPHHEIDFAEELLTLFLIWYLLKKDI